MKSLFNIFCLCEEHVMRDFLRFWRGQISCSYNLDTFLVATPQRAFTCSKSTIKTQGVKWKFTTKPRREFVSFVNFGRISHCFSVSIVDFEQANARWGIKKCRVVVPFWKTTAVFCSFKKFKSVLSRHLLGQSQQHKH